MDRSPISSTRAVLPLVLFAALGVANLWQLALQGAGIDFFQFWAVGQAVEESLVGDVYAPGARPALARTFLLRAEEAGSAPQRIAAQFRREEIQVSNSPVLYAFFHAIQSGRYETDIARYRLLCLACTIGSVLALCLRFGYSWPGALAALGFALWAFNPLVDDIREGNVNQIQLAGLALFLVLPGRIDSVRGGLLRGAVLGAAIAFKPNLVFAAGLLGIGWLVSRRFKTLLLGSAGMAAGMIAAVVASLPLFSSARPWLAWAESLRTLAGEFRSTVGWGNFAGGWLLGDVLGVSLAPVLYLACLAAVAWCVWVGRRDGGAAGEDLDLREDRILAGLGPVVPLLAGDLAWPHYLILAIPLILLLLAPGSRPSWIPWAACGALLLVCSRPILEVLRIGGDYVTAAALAAGAAAIFTLGCVLAAAPSGRLAPRP